ncbi:MAG: glycosyltransferase [Candidatus Aenigmarchaeota archaeon]|nr:glycosyltransferase [Candidatus Aenigmarchaeota archaeon]
MIIPALNEEETISKVVRDFKREMKGAEIIVYDGNSTDATRRKAKAAGAKVFVQKGRGKGTAMREVLENIDTDIYLFVDADDTYPAERAKDIIAPILNGESDMVVGTRAYRERGAMSALHVVGNRIITGTINLCFGMRFKDVLSGYRALSKEVAKDLYLASSGFEVETELTINTLIKKYRIVEIPTEYRCRPKGSASKLGSFADGYIIFFTILSLFRDYRPLLFFGTMAATLFTAGGIIGLAVVIEWLQTGLVLRIPSAILSTLFILTAIQLASVGMSMDMMKNNMTRLNYEIKKANKKKPIKP